MSHDYVLYMLYILRHWEDMYSKKAKRYVRNAILRNTSNAVSEFDGYVNRFSRCQHSADFPHWKKVRLLWTVYFHFTRTKQAEIESLVRVLTELRLKKSVPKNTDFNTVYIEELSEMHQCINAYTDMFHRFNHHAFNKYYDYHRYGFLSIKIPMKHISNAYADALRDIYCTGRSVNVSVVARDNDHIGTKKNLFIADTHLHDDHHYIVLTDPENLRVTPNHSVAFEFDIDVNDIDKSSAFTCTNYRIIQ